MSKTLKQLVKDLQYLKDWTIEQVAESIGYSRVHLSKEMKKGDNEELKNLLLAKHGKILQNVSREEEIPIPDTMQFLSEKMLLLEAGMEVQRSMLIDLLAAATGKTTTEISTEVAKALDYQISKRVDELRK